MAKNKQKTHKSTQKRFTLTGRGKVMQDKQRARNSSHLRNKRKSTKKIIPEFLKVDKVEAKRIKKLLNK